MHVNGIASSSSIKSFNVAPYIQLKKLAFLFNAIQDQVLPVLY